MSRAGAQETKGQGHELFDSVEALETFLEE